MLTAHRYSEPVAARREMRAFSRTGAALALLMALLLGSCGGPGSLSCADFVSLSAADQSEAIAEVSADVKFDATDDDIARMRSGAERACAGNADQEIGSIVDGFIAALAD